MSIQPGPGYNFVHSGNATSLSVDQPWQFWAPPAPFTVTASYDGTDYIVSVVPGTINNIEPKMSGDQLSANPPPTMNIGHSGSSTTIYIYLLMPVGSGTPPAFPDNPTIINDSSPQTSDDSQAYLLLASVDNSTGVVSQYVGGSQWGERYKCGTVDAAYYFGLV